MYAQNTTVPVEKSLEEIRQTLSKVGAVGFSFGNHAGQAYIAFYHSGRVIKMVFEVPVNPGPDARLAELKKYEQARRTKWRQILLCVRAKFEIVMCGIETFEQAFMAHIVLKDGNLLGEEAQSLTVNNLETNVSEMLGFVKEKPDAA